MGMGGFEMRHEWCKEMGTPFRFLDLPPELQDRVILPAMGERVAVNNMWEDQDNGLGRQVSTKTNRLTLERGMFPDSIEKDENCRHENPGEDITLPAVQPPDVAVFSLRRIVRTRTKHVLWMHTRKVFTAPRLASMHGATFITAPFRDFLTHVELAFSHSAFLEFFRIDLPGFSGSFKSVYPAVVGPLPVVAVFPTLRSLDLSFRSAVSKLNSPWSHPDAFAYELFPGIDLERHPCQKTLVDMIMAFAYQHVRHVPQVRLVGYVKTETKLKWEAMLNDKTRMEYTYLVEAEKVAILSLPNSAL